MFRFQRKVSPRPPRQFLVLTSPAKTWQGFESSALHFQICLVDFANRFSSDFYRFRSRIAPFPIENQCFSSEYQKWGPHMTPISRCHHASDVHRFSQWHVGRGPPPCAINAQNITSGEHQRRVPQNLKSSMLVSVALHVLIFNVLQTSGQSLAFIGRPSLKTL